MEWIAEELYILLCSVWTGCVIYSAYVGVRIVRSLIKHKEFFVSLEDFLYWLFVSFYGFDQIFRSSKGVLRWYALIGIGVGCLSAHTIWYSGKKVLETLKKSLKKKPENRIIKR